MKKRFFNLTGHCDPAKHYTVNPLRGFGDKIMDLLEKKIVFCNSRPTTDGKNNFVALINTTVERVG